MTTDNEIDIPETTFVSIINGGTSRGLYFDAADLPANPVVRDAVLLDLIGAPEQNRIRGLGGGDGLTNKIAIIGPSTRPDADIDYEFVQAVPGEARLERAQTCGNILVGVGPYAIEHGFVPASGDVTSVRVHQVNTGAVTNLTVQTPVGIVTYKGDQKIEGVSGSAAPVTVDFAVPDLATLMPTGNVVDIVDGMKVTMVNWNMPVVVTRAEALGLSGYESHKDLQVDADVMARLNQLRLAAGKAMGMGDVTTKTIPKVALLASPREAGHLVSTRCMINSGELHKALGVGAAASIGWACLLPDSPVHDLAMIPPGQDKLLNFETPTGVRSLRVVVGGSEAAPILLGGGEISAAWKINAGRKFEVNINRSRVIEFIKLAIL